VGSANQLIDRTLPVTERIEKLPPRGFGKQLKDVVHTSYMPKGIYVGLRM
jgi:hypothetical protein